MTRHDRPAHRLRYRYRRRPGAALRGGLDDCEIDAVSCVAGNVGLADVVRNTLAVLELAGRSDIEVAAGRDRPIVRALRTAPDTHGATGLGYAELPVATRAASGRDGADLIIARAQARPGELTLVTLGPLGNVAVALEREPALPRLLDGLVMMVGSFRSPGNTAPTMEWNAGVDPEALAAVIAGWQSAAAVDSEVARPRALGLDVTERARMLPKHIDQLGTVAGAADAPVVRFVADALRFYFEFHEQNDGFYGAFIHDALAVAAAIDPSIVVSRPLAVEIELEGRWTTGETVADWRGAWEHEPNVDVVIEADTDVFFERFIERVGRLARSGTGMSGQ